MKAYGLDKITTGDDDKGGCAGSGRATAVYAVPGLGGDARAFHSLRGGRKAATRRSHKRVARREGRALCADID